MKNASKADLLSVVVSLNDESVDLETLYTLLISIIDKERLAYIS
jgi:hypothetical protein